MPVKKKKASGKTKKRSVVFPELPPLPPDTKIPILTNPKVIVLLSAANEREKDSLLRLVTHYNYENEMGMTDFNGSTPLHIATKNRNIDLVKVLVTYKQININAREKKMIGGFTCIHHACYFQAIDVLNVLLQAGADPNIKADSDLGETPLHLCCRLGYITCADRLIKYGASVETRDNFGNNPSFWARAKNFDNMIRILNLPAPKTPTPDEYLKLLQARNPFFLLPTVKPKKVIAKGAKGTAAAATKGIKKNK